MARTGVGMGMGAGRPLRFLGMTVGGWVAIRVVLLWPTVATVPDLIRVVVPGIPRAAAPPRRLIAALGLPPSRASVATAPHRAPSHASDARVASPRDPHRLAFALAAMVGYGREESVEAPGAIPPPLRPTPVAVRPKRLSASIWGIARGGASGPVLGGQLGGSQAGMRVTYGLGAARRFALAARVATALGGAGPGRREAALGVEWRVPGLARRVPVRVVAEQRIALDGGRGGTAAGVIAGLDAVPVAAGFRLEAYGQAGAILRDRAEGYADGAARLARPVATPGAMALDLGIGAWGAAQPGVGRIDIGPSIGAVVPVGATRLRITLDWRQRIAGRARPGSGPALSIGSDF